MSSPIGRALFFVALSAAPIAWAGPPDSSTRKPARSPEVTRAPEDLLRTVERENRLVTAQVRAEVEGELRDASAGMANDPIAVQTCLKSLIERVIQLPQLPAAERASLRGQLEIALREANRRAVTKDALDARVAAERAAAQDRLRVVEVLARNQQRLKQLMDRFDALMDERRWEAADGVAAEVIAETDQDAPIAASARFVARQVGSHLTNVALRDARQKGVVATLASVDTAHLPFPGDQPMIYPQAADWRELSQRRHQAAIESLRSHSKSEAKIIEQLREPTAMEFIETPLEDVVAYLKDLHGIEIQLDRKALEDANLGGDAPVTIAMQGISLRSSLRQMLRTLGLTYVIKDEVLLITTSEVADNELVTRVYPLADLVVPIQSSRTTGRGTSNSPSGQGMTGPGINGMNPGGPGMNLPGMNGPGINAPGNNLF